MKTRTLLILLILSICSNLFAQKAQIDPYLRAAHLAYGKTSGNGKALNAQDIFGQTGFKTLYCHAHLLKTDR